jgi:hypothetical protein
MEPGKTGRFKRHGNEWNDNLDICRTRSSQVLAFLSEG